MAAGQVFSWIKAFYPQYIGIKRYPANQCALVDKSADEWGILGNFGRASVVVNGVEFSNTEKLFQCMKFRSAEAVRAVYAQKGLPIKNVARKWEKTDMREDWPTYFLDALKFVLMTKYEQSEAFRADLERSKGLYIVEDETNRLKNKKNKEACAYATARKGDEMVGPNLLGQFLMELRDTGKLDYTLPDDALDFIEHLK